MYVTERGELYWVPRRKLRSHTKVADPLKIVCTHTSQTTTRGWQRCRPVPPLLSLSSLFSEISTKIIAFSVFWHLFAIFLSLVAVQWYGKKKTEVKFTSWKSTSSDSPDGWVLTFFIRSIISTSIPSVGLSS